MTTTLTGTLLKESITILSINSNQRQYFTDEELTVPDPFQNYIDPADYDAFAALYNQAKEMSQQLQVMNYQEYAAENNIDLAGLQINQRCRDIVKTTRERSMATRDGGTISLLNPVAEDVWPQTDLESLVNRLNSYVMAAPAHNPLEFWRPFHLVRDGSRQRVMRRVYYEQHPNKYTLTLPSSITHVKAIKLVSTEIPNVINNINSRNNIITLQLRLKEGEAGDPPAIDPTKSIFDFILVKLPVGCYNMTSLISALQLNLNSACQQVLVTPENYVDLFTVTWDHSSGLVTITCNQTQLEFHLKFYSRLTDMVDIPVDSLDPGKSIGMTKDYTHDLWYMLGFPWPYQVTSTGDDRFTSVLTNLVNNGIHAVLGPGSGLESSDIFDRMSAQEQLAHIYSERHNLETGSQYEIFNSYRVHRFPQVDIKYVYLVLKGLPNIQHIAQYNGVTSYKKCEPFAKIQMDEIKGKVAYNTFVNSPLVFVNAIESLDRLEIEWVDERGQLVDFGGVDHSFTLEVVHYITQLENSGYDTVLGNSDKRSYPGTTISYWPPFQGQGQG